MIDRTAFKTLSKIAGIFVIISVLVVVLIETQCEAEGIIHSEYMRGYNDALKHQEFKIGQNQDTIFIYHDGARLTILAASDTVYLDFVRSDSTN